MKYLILACIPFFWVIGCKEMDSTYKQYVVPNGITYPGKVLSPVAKSGFNQIQLTWKRSADPKVVKARIYWNYYTDSVDVVMPEGQQEFTYVVQNLNENFYTFIIKSYDNNSNASVPVEVSGTSLGERYKSILLNRTISSVINIDNSVTFSLEELSNTSTIVGSEIEYTTNSGAVKVVNVDEAANSLVLTDYKLGSTYKLRTTHMATNSFEAITSLDQTMRVNLLNKREWSIVGYSSFYNTDTPEKMIDGNPATRWGTLSPHVYPHFFTVDLGVVRTITSISLWRQSPANMEGPDRVQFFGSNDNQEFVDLGEYNFDIQDNNEQKYMLTGTNNYRYLKIVQLRGPKGYVVMGEFDVTVM